MGFSDLISSSRGPGVAGTIIAVLVLGGFGTLFWVFDKDMEKAGGKKIEAVVRDLGLEIEGKQTQLLSFKKLVAEGDLLKGQPEKIAEYTKDIESSKSLTAELETKIQQANAAIESAKQAWEDYKNQYREQVWEAAIGRKLGDLKGIASGKVYVDAVINKVDHTGIRITDSTGPKGITLEDLPASLREELQLDEDLAGKQREEDDVKVGNHIDAADLAGLREAQANLNNAIKNQEEKSRAAAQAAKAAQDADSDYRTRISRLKSKIRSESSGGGISNAPQLKGDLQRLEAQAAKNKASIEPNKQAAQAARSKVDELRGKARELDKKIEEQVKSMQQKAASNADPAGATQ